MPVRIPRPRFVRAAPAGPAEPQGSTPFFSDSFSTGNFSKWNSLQWNAGGTIRNGAGTAYSGTGEYPCQVVAIDGRTSVARFELRDGDIPFSDTERTEIGEPFTSTLADVEVHQGDERWFGWDMKFHSTWPVPHASSIWFVVWQWHISTAVGASAVCLDIDSDDVIYFANNNETGYQRTAVQSVVRDQWQRWVCHIKFSDNPAVGYVEVWVDGVAKIPKEFRRTMAVGDTSSYHKLGVYRDAVNTATAIVYFDNLSYTAP